MGDVIYAINKATKEHRVIPKFVVFPREDWDHVLADPDGWIPWSAQEDTKCPLPVKDLCEVKLKGGGEYHHLMAGEWSWGSGTQHRKIIAYRPIVKSGESFEFNWDGEGLPPVGTECEAITEYGYLPCRIVSEGDDYVVVHFLPNKYDLKVDWTRTGCRPLQSDRDKWIEAANKAGGSLSEASLHRLGKIYDAGLGKLPENGNE